MRRLILLLLVSGWWGWLAGCAGTPPSVRSQQLPTELPIRWRGTEPAVEVFVNGRGPFLFALDTGAADFARADSSLVELLGLSRTGIDITNDASGRNAKILGTHNLASLTVGGIEFANVEVSSRDFNRSDALPRVDGILAFDLFAGYLLTLDYPGGRVRIEQGELPPPDGAEILPLMRIKGLPAVEVMIADQRVVAEIDSGNTLCGFFFPASLVKRLPMATEPVAAGNAATVSNVGAVRKATLDGSVRLGEHEFSRPEIVFPTPFDFANIGSPVLRDFVITFDQRNHRVRFVRRGPVGN